ncbi:MAG: tetratricopeptide repeat protein [Bacteroidetes bacterium]|nr:tetratricopeptide repeat protein [Bacteroidota bacterium]
MKVAKIAIPLVSLLIIISSCSDKKQEGKYDDILSQPIFRGVTDSIRQFPDKEALYFRRAVLLNTNDFPEPALEDFRKAWSLKKRESFALGISTILLEKKPEEAIRFLEGAIKELPESRLLQLSLARALAAQNKVDEALVICNKILQQNPQQVDLLKMKADLLYKKGNNAEALSILEKAYQLTPYEIELNYILALNYAETGNPKVITLCDSLIKVDTAGLHAEPYYYKGIYYATRKETASAISMFDASIKHDYTFINSYIEKGSLLYELKRYPEALKVFNLALTISPDYADNYYWIGKCQEAMGQKEEAKLNYQRTLGIDKDFKEAREALERMK